jgi:putative glutamine amidotransferase
VRRALGVLAVLELANPVFTAWASTSRGPAAPRIGVVVSDAWFDAAGINPAAYEVALARAGANAVRRHADEGLDGLDGLVLVGGGDVDPLRDAAELELIREAERRGVPVLAICRGAQVLATAFGGRLEPLDGARAGRHGVSIRSLSAHGVDLVPGTRAAAMYAGPGLRVSSTHAFAIAEAGPRLRVAARSDDGVIEAVESAGGWWAVGLQWHPEWEGLGSSARLAPFRALVSVTKHPV